MNPMPASSMDLLTSFGVALMLTPSFSRRSALPHLLVTDLFPCFATGTPAPATTKELIVLMLNVFRASPPVPHRSVRSGEFGGRVTLIFSALERIARANPTISSIVSPFIRSAVRKAPIWLWVARPDIISSAMSEVSLSSRSLPEMTLEIAVLMLLDKSELLVSHRCSNHVKKILDDLHPLRRGHGLWMELGSEDRVIRVPDAHDLSVLERGGGDLELVRDAVAHDHERVVSRGGDGIRQAWEYVLPAVFYP